MRSKRTRNDGQLFRLRNFLEQTFVLGAELFVFSLGSLCLGCDCDQRGDLLDNALPDRLTLFSSTLPPRYFGDLDPLTRIFRSLFRCLPFQLLLAAPRGGLFVFAARTVFRLAERYAQVREGLEKTF